MKFKYLTLLIVYLIGMSFLWAYLVDELVLIISLHLYGAGALLLGMPLYYLGKRVVKELKLNTNERF